MNTINLETEIVRSNNFITSTVDNEVMMMSIEKGVYFSLDDIGSLIWEQISEPTHVSALCTHLSTQFNVDLNQCQTDTLAFLNDLAAEDMIHVVDE